MPGSVKKYLLVILFPLMLSVPLLNALLGGLFKDIDPFENRALAKMPDMDWKHLDPYPEQYEAWYNDHFMLRNLLIRNYAVYKLQWLRQSPFPEAIIVGKDNWLYQSTDELDVYAGKTRLSAEEIQLLKREMQYRAQYLAERGCRFYLMIVPCKAVVHDEHMYYQYYRVNKVSMGEELADSLAGLKNVNQINLYKLLRETKKQGDVYYKMDTHWNKMGALTAANVFFEKVQDLYPEVTPLKVEEVKRVKIKSPDLLKMVGNVSFLEEFENEPVLEGGTKAKPVAKAGYIAPEGFPYNYMYETGMQTADTSKPRLLLISDSFGENIFPYLAENFSRSLRLWDAWQYKLNEEVVAMEKPDVMLLVVHEKNLKNMLRYLSAPKP